jgi:hypothetical protein
VEKTKLEIDYDLNFLETFIEKNATFLKARENNTTEHKIPLLSRSSSEADAKNFIFLLSDTSER